MKIREFLDKLFRRKSSINSIVLLGGIVDLPTRDLIGDKTQLEELDKYKKEYWNILSNRKIFISKDLESNFQENIMMNTELLLKTMQENSMEELFYQEMEKESFFALRNQVSLYKLNEYYEIVRLLEQEMTLRGITLKELLMEKMIVSPNKKNAIKEEINHLSATIMMARSQKYAITLEANSHILNAEEAPVTCSMKQKKIEVLNKMVKAVFPSYLIEEEQSIQAIAKLERMLEVYFYKKKGIEKETLMTTYDDTSEFKLWAMAIYGKDLVTEEDLARFYENKFDHWSQSLFEQEDVFILSEDERRLLNKEARNKVMTLSAIDKYFYPKIVEKKLSNLLKGNFGAYQEIFHKNPNKNMEAAVCLSVSHYLQNKRDGKFYGTEILENVNKLQLLLSFEKKGRLEQYFYRHFYEPDYSISEQNEISLHRNIVYASAYPLEVLYFIDYVDSNMDTVYDSGNNYLFGIYHALRKAEGTTFTFPRDIKQIKRDDRIASDRNWIKNLRALSKGKSLVIHPDMKISSGVFDKLKFDKVFFQGNNGIYDDFCGCQIEEIYFNKIPDLCASFENTMIKKIWLTDFRLRYTSQSVQDRLTDFLYSFVWLKFAGMEKEKDRSTYATYQAIPQFEELNIGPYYYIFKKKELMKYTASRFDRLELPDFSLTPEEQEDKRKIIKHIISCSIDEVIGRPTKFKESYSRDSEQNQKYLVKQ